MRMSRHTPDWLSDLSWRGYPRIEPISDVSALAETDLPARATRPGDSSEPRLTELAKENEALRGRLESLTRLSREFSRHLSETASAYEGALLEIEAKLRVAAFERERLSGELEATRSEAQRLGMRDAAREADLKLERERNADAQKTLHDAQRRLEELGAQADRVRSAAAEQAGMMGELRRQAEAQNERLLRAKALTDEDVRLLRQEMRDFLAHMRQIQDSLAHAAKGLLPGAPPASGPLG
jgi:chromosome segregation ATPase